jgi:hypothetical protein
MLIGKTLLTTPLIQLCAMLVGAGLVLTVAGQTPIDRTPPLLRPTGVERGLGTHRRADVVRHRTVTPDLVLLDQLRPGVGDRFTLNLFADITLTAEVRRKDFPGAAIGHPTSFSLSGPIVGDPGATFNLVVHRGVVAAVITLPDRTTYQIHALAAGRHEVCQLDFSRHGGCAVEEGGAPAFNENPVAADFRARLEPAVQLAAGVFTTVDMMILYTPAARDLWGGVATTEAEAMLAIDVSNTALIDSLIDVEFRLVHVGEFAYVETANTIIDLQNITFDSTLDTLRDQVAADNVSLFLSGGDSCGSAWILNAGSFLGPAESSYNVCVIGCAAQNLTYPHEVGHNLGCGHEPGAGNSLVHDARGHVDPGGAFRTILANVDEAIPRVGHFSNPEVNRVLRPTGVTGVSDNARLINITSGIMAAYRGQACPEWAFDCNLNCIDDYLESLAGLTPDCNANGVPDACDFAGTSADCDNNGVPDECEGYDCNGNGVLDRCDVTSETSPDCNVNGVPDECDEDCNGNGLPDLCDIQNQSSSDCNRNFVPDECDVAGGTSSDLNSNNQPDECETDCNANGVPDSFDIAIGASSDCSLNGVPDECEDCDGDGIADVCGPTTQVSFDSGVLSLIDTAQSVTHTFELMRLAFSDVELEVDAVVGLWGSNRWLEVQLNGTTIGRVFDGAEPLNCFMPVSDQLVIPLDDFNVELNAGAAAVTLTPAGVTASGCSGDTWTSISLTYLNIAFEDVNGNGMSDACERSGGDINLDGVVAIDDFLSVLANWGPCVGPSSACPWDVDSDGLVGILDFLTVLANWG